MKQPLSVIVITKDPKTQQEVHSRFDALTSHPKWKLFAILLRAMFSV